MKKLIVAPMICGLSLMLNAQTLYIAKNTEIIFFSKAPLEDIQAINKEAKSLIDIDKNEIAVMIGIRQFRFPKALMEEHFNENYLESDKFKTATFRGKINEKIDWTKDGTYQVSSIGKLNIHGVEQERQLNGTLTIKGGTITLNATFKIALKDHDIKIPVAVVLKIAEVVDVTLNINYERKK